MADYSQMFSNPWLNMGLGILSANKPGASFGEAVGGGGLLGMQNYQQQQAYQQQQELLKRNLAEEEAARQQDLARQQAMSQFFGQQDPRLAQLAQFDPSAAVGAWRDQAFPKKPEAPTGMRVGPNGEWEYDPNYLAGQERLRAAGASSPVTQVVLPGDTSVFNKKIQEGQKITEGNMKKPRKVVDDYLNIAGIFDMNDVKRKIEELKAAMDNTDAGSIRDSWAFANNFAMSIKGMAENIGEMTGLSSDGSVKRRIKLDKAA
jgi:hypothetical protein